MKTLFWFVLALFLFTFQNTFSQTIVINEIITSNSTVIADDDGSYEDWIELYNSGTESVNLSGFGLSDNTNLFKWVFPDYSIQPNEHLLIWCSNKNRTNPLLPLHTNFAISSSGETITLTKPDGIIVDQIPAIVIPQNSSYGRITDGHLEKVIFPVPTPGFENFYQDETIIEEIEVPNFSVNSGFYTSNFSLTISHPNPQAVIIYTLDGSEPKLENMGGITYNYKNSYREQPQDIDGTFLQNTYKTLIYENDLLISDRSLEPNKISAISTTFSNVPYLPQNPVFKGTVVRAKAIVNNTESKTVTKNYFISPLGANRYTFPIITLNLDEDKYYKYESGLNVAGLKFDTWRDENTDSFSDIFTDANYWNSGSSSEIKLNFSYIENGVELLNHDAGLRNQGNGSRHMRNRSVRLYAKPEYGSSYFNYSFFKDYNYDQFKRIILRNSGNDGYKTGFRDAFIQKIVRNLNFEIQEFRPAIVFVNSEYNGIYNIRERYDEHYFKRVFGIEPNELDFLENYGIVDTGDADHYYNMINYLQSNDLSNTNNFNYVKTLLDPVNYTDYYITNIFVANYDWPANNNEYWRKKTNFTPNAPYGQDGRWRWVLKDTDFGFNLFEEEDYNLDMLEKATKFYEPFEYDADFYNLSTLIMRKLLENESYKNHFVNRFADLLNTTFLSSRLTSMINEMHQLFLPEINEHIHRWQMIQSYESWENSVNIMRHFAEVRPSIQRNHIREKFNIEENITVNLNVSNESHGFVKINTININPETEGVAENPYPWNGIYFKNIPITVKAIAKSGFTFTHWSGDSINSEEEITLTPNGNIQLTAHFEPAETEPEEIPLYFWVFDSTVPNDTPLTSITSSFEVPNINGALTFQSCLDGYPFNSSHPNWRKASMERRNSPTNINYLPEANNDIPFDSSNMKGIQIKQPFQNNGLENQMIFSFSTYGYENILFEFTAKNENAADAILIDYSISENEPIWTTNGLNDIESQLTSDYQLFTIDFSSINTINNNPNFKVRLRFDGQNMTADNGNRVTFNNFSVKGSSFMNVDENIPLQFNTYPNPVTDKLYLIHDYSTVEYALFSIDGKLIKQGILLNSSINTEDIQRGIYLLKLTANNKSLVKKIVKK